MNRRVEELLQRSIKWHDTPNDEMRFYAVIDGVMCYLTLNDWPDEPKHTLELGDESIDLENTPKLWLLPYQKDKKTSSQ